VNRLVIFGAVIAIAALGLVVYLSRNTDDSPAAHAPLPAPSPTAPASPSAPAAPTVAPSLPGSAAAPTGSDDAVTYKLDGVTVHDHRGSNAGPPIDLPPNLHPPGSRTIPPALTGAIAREERRVLAECEKSLPPGPHGGHPHIDGEIVISIKSGRATVTKALIQPRELIGDAGPLKQCVEDHSAGIAVDSLGEADLDAYSIHVSLALGLPAPPPAPTP